MKCFHFYFNEPQSRGHAFVFTSSTEEGYWPTVLMMKNSHNKTKNTTLWTYALFPGVANLGSVAGFNEGLRDQTLGSLSATLTDSPAGALTKELHNLTIRCLNTEVLRVCENAGHRVDTCPDFPPPPPPPPPPRVWACLYRLDTRVHF